MNAEATEIRLENTAVQFRIKIAAAILITASILGLALSTAHGDTIPGWRSDVATAFEEARTSGSPLILLVAADGCSACAEFAEEAGKAPAVSALSGMVRVQAEASEHPDLVSKYAAEGTPTIVVLSADTGYDTPVYTHTGVLNAAELVRLAGMVIQQGPVQDTVESANPDASKLDQDIVPTSPSQNHASAPGKRRVLGHVFASVNKLTARIIR
jgi:hypothetical protein